MNRFLCWLFGLKGEAMAYDDCAYCERCGAWWFKGDIQ